MRGKRAAGPPRELYTRLDEGTEAALLSEQRSRGFASRGELLQEILSRWAEDSRFRRRVVVPAPKNRGPRTAGIAFLRPGAMLAEALVAECAKPNRLFYAILVAWTELRRAK